MGRVVIGVMVVLAFGWAVHRVSAWSFRRFAAGLEALIGWDPSAVVRTDLPEPVRRLALKGLAGHAPVPGRVTLEQAAEMELRPGAGWQPIAARQVIGVTEAGFVWQAWQKKGPLVLVRVVDAFVAGKGQLRVRLLGSVPVARAEGPAMDRGEAMRYLAELPWAPDAILLNRALHWRMLESGEIEVRLKMAPRDAVVRFAVDAAGDPAVMRAEDRPAGDVDGAQVLKDWEGRFSDFNEIGGRRIPLSGEVGYVGEGKYQPYWRGRISQYRID